MVHVFLLASGWLPGSLGTPWLVVKITPVSTLSSYGVFLPFMYLCVFFPLIRTPAIGVRAHHNPQGQHFH